MQRGQIVLFFFAKNLPPFCPARQSFGNFPLCLTGTSFKKLVEFETRFQYGAQSSKGEPIL
ncbi:hypothetical protein CH361_08965 [Leptospira brenneri]|nr:hypothetical protein CH361_08965 [Leptospira brenneri]